MKSEIWKPVEGYEAFIEVSNLGRVRTVTRAIPLNGGVRIYPSQICTQRLKKNGYFQISVRLGPGNGRKWFLVHRLVAKAFIENPFGLPQVNHKDGNKQNNVDDNLEWCDESYNQNHAVKMGLCKNEERHYKVKLTREQVLAIRESTDPSGIEALKHGVSRSTVKCIRRRKTWKYVERER